MKPLSLPLSLSQPVSFTPSFVTRFSLSISDMSPSLIRGPLLLSGSLSNHTVSPVLFLFFSALHWASSLLSLSYLFVSLSQQLITAFNPQLLSISLSC